MATSQQLPDEIIINVLLRLGVKPLLRCKSVSKSWYSFISDPHFVKSHFKLSSANNHHRLLLLTTKPDIVINTCSLNDVLYNHKSVTFEELAYPLNQFPWKQLGQRFSVVGCCNGLFCVAIGKDNVFIWNPSTRKTKMLPNCDSEPWRGWYGFGYDDSCDDYKVVALYVGYQGPLKCESKVRIYSLKTGKWKILPDFPPCLASVYGCKFLNRAFYWMVFCYQKSLDVIISLDLATETFSVVLWPVFENISKAFGFWVLEKQLCMTCSYSGRHTDVWVMKSKDSWTKLVSIRHPTDCWNFKFPMPLCISKNGKLLLKMDKKLGLYDPSSTSFSEFQNFPEFLEEYIYVENLVSLNGVANNNDIGN